MRKFSAVLCLALGLFMVSPSLASATPLMASEVLEDALQLELFTRNLTRTRTGPSGTVTDTPGAENAVSADFGLWSTNDVSWTHDLSWLPTGAQILSATLEVRTFGTDDSNDNLFADNVFFASLSPEFLSGIGVLDLFTSTTTSSSPLLMSGLLADRTLNLLVDKNGAFLNPDPSSVYYSRLDVTFEPVPEPASMLLLGSGLATVIARQRRKRARP